MSLFDRFFDKKKDKTEHHRTDDEQAPFDPNVEESVDGDEPFLERIREFALRACPQELPAYHATSDLPGLTIDAFEEPPISETHIRRSMIVF